MWHQCLLLLSGVNNWATLSRLKCENALAPCKHDATTCATAVACAFPAESGNVGCPYGQQLASCASAAAASTATRKPVLCIVARAQPQHHVAAVLESPHALETVHRGRSRAAESVAPTTVVIRPVSLPVAPPPLLPRAGVVAVAGPVAIPAAGRKGLALGCRFSSSSPVEEAGVEGAQCWRLRRRMLA